MPMTPLSPAEEARLRTTLTNYGLLQHALLAARQFDIVRRGAFTDNAGSFLCALPPGGA
jgi:hypothetical protein